MKSGVRYINLLGVFLISLFNSKATTDTLQLVRSGDSLFNLNSFRDAGNFYQKASYYSFSSKNKVALLLKKTACLKQLGQYAEAEQIIWRTGTDLQDSLLSRLLGEGALCSYLSSDYPKAESYLVTLEYKLNDKSLIIQHLVLYALILNEQARWAEAKEKLSSFVTNNFKYNADAKARYLLEIDSLYNPLNYPKLKSANKAKIMSHIIPGSGQMYAGYFLEGLSSMALNTLALAGTAVGIYFHYYFSSVVLGNYFFAKFYLGNVARAQFLVNKRNYFRKNRFNSVLKPKLLQFYQ